MGTWHEDLCTFIISRPVIVKMGNVSHKSCRNSKHTFDVQSFVFENHAVHAIMWENTVQPDRPQMRIQRMRIACWIPKATDTQSEYVMHIAFHCNNGNTSRLHVKLYVHYLSCYLTGSCRADKLSLKYEHIYSRTPIWRPWKSVNRNPLLH